ncbi:sensor histidine kinase [Bifidobacterium aerophilum]|uniref:histidine kinase n=2 Tax=Bifidobacterium aerophilum TaxID=1798155 RepID=A0A6N9Z5I3_9BIFI|nr:histidine kinase [Bifidobacterium aerophilum]NEG89868.1 sensor histidine kinase [Bifidobacterium aerophilum]
MLVMDSITALLLTLVFGLLFGSAGSGFSGPLFSYGTGWQMLWSTAMTAPTATRRLWPQGSALAFAAMAVLQLIVGPSMVFADFLSLLLLYSVIVYGDPRNTKAFIVLASALGVLASAVISWSALVGPYFEPYMRPADISGVDLNGMPECWLVYADGRFTGQCAQNLMQQTAVYAAAILSCIVATVIAAFWQRARLITIRMMQERNDALQASEAEERRIAALAERARIARDMHDVVAHTLSIIIVQSDGGRYAGAHDPAVARHTMETIRHESERALHDMKRLFGVFGGSMHADYTDIDALVEQARAAVASSSESSSAGTTSPVSSPAVSASSVDSRIDRHIDGTARPELLSVTASAAVYHLVQESLTNVRKYAGPNVHVVIGERWSDHALDITVTDDGRGASSALDGHQPGYGLLGMRERVEAAGGTVTSGPRVGGGFAVHAVIPLGAAVTVKPYGGIGAAARPAPAAAPTGQVSPIASSTGQADSSVISTERGERRHPVTSVLPRHDVPARPRPVRPGNDAYASAGIRAPWTPALPQIPTWSQLRDRLRSKPIAQAVLANGEPFNWVERLSQWTERHYLTTDIIGTLLLIMIMCANTISMFDGYLDGVTGELAVGRFIVVTTMLPLCFRRRFPEGAALMVVIMSVFQLVMFEPVLLSNLFALCALYSAVLYGRPTAWRWTGVASIGVAMLFGVKVLASDYGYASVLHWMLRSADYAGIGGSPLRLSFGAAMWSGMIGAMCMGTILLARWQRSSGANVLVLQAREEALQAEQSKQKVLAANMERERISASIQAEVSDTLALVIDRAVAGIRMLDEAEARGEEPSAESIAAAFASIGQQGRTALKHMRQLLSVLRETGFSDEAHEHAQPEMRLRPAASLDEQLDAAGTSR